MSQDEKNAVMEITRVFAFEHWARFYYAVDREGKTFLEAPEDVLAAVRTQAADLAPMLEEINHKELSYETSCKNVGTFVCELLDGTKYKPGLVQRLLDSRPYRMEMHLFSLWLQGHEGYLDANPQTFPEWLDMYLTWKELDQVKEYIKSLDKQPAAAQGSNAVH